MQFVAAAATLPRQPPASPVVSSPWAKVAVAKAARSSSLPPTSCGGRRSSPPASSTQLRGAKAKAGGSAGSSSAAAAVAAVTVATSSGVGGRGVGGSEDAILPPVFWLRTPWEDKEGCPASERTLLCLAHDDKEGPLGGLWEDVRWLFQRHVPRHSFDELRDNAPRLRDLLRSWGRQIYWTLGQDEEGSVVLGFGPNAKQRKLAVKLALLVSRACGSEDLERDLARESAGTLLPRIMERARICRAQLKDKAVPGTTAKVVSESELAPRVYLGR